MLEELPGNIPNSEYKTALSLNLPSKFISKLSVKRND
jgi:hypothetical protein